MNFVIVVRMVCPVGYLSFSVTPSVKDPGEYILLICCWVVDISYTFLLDI